MNFTEQMEQSESRFRTHQAKANQLIQNKAYSAAILELNAAIQAMQEYYAAWRAQKSQDGYWLMSFRSNSIAEKNLADLRMLLGNCYVEVDDFSRGFKAYSEISWGYVNYYSVEAKINSCREQMITQAMQLFTQATAKSKPNELMAYQWKIIREGINGIAQNLVTSGVGLSEEQRIEKLAEINGVFIAYKKHLNDTDILYAEKISNKLQELTARSDVPVATPVNVRRERARL